MIDQYIDPQILEDTADDTTIMSITRSYTQEELTNFKLSLSAATIENKARANALAAIKKEFEITQDPEMLLTSVTQIIENCEELTEAGTKSLNSEIADYISKLKTKKYTKDEEVYILKDYEDSRISYYDQFGHLVSSRPMRPDERQTTIKTLKSIKNG